MQSLGMWIGLGSRPKNIAPKARSLIRAIVSLASSVFQCEAGVPQGTLLDVVECRPVEFHPDMQGQIGGVHVDAGYKVLRV